jgi:hypothetical protein
MDRNEKKKEKSCVDINEKKRKNCVFFLLKKEKYSILYKKNTKKEDYYE